MLPLSNKPLLVLYAALDTFSGYGARGRDLATALIQSKEPEYDVRFMPCNWGATPHGALDESNPKHKAILDRFIPGGQLPKQPDVWIMNTVPNEMQRVGAHFNILITAGVETHIATSEFVEGCNKADLVLTSSEFTKEVLLRSSFEKVNNQTKQKEGELRVTSKVDVLFEGLDVNVYHKQVDKYFDFDFDRGIDEAFAFLFVGHWINGELFHDRKNLASTIKIFLETFKDQKTTPALILKTSGGAPSIIDREHILDKIDAIRKTVKAKTLPNIYLAYGDFSDEDMNELYGHPQVKALILLGNEGFGRPLLEFSVHQKPIIASNYSGHLDFLNPEFNVLVPGQLQKIHPSVAVKGIIPEEGAWYYPNPIEASNALKNVYENYKNYMEGAKRQAYRSRTEFNLASMQDRLVAILDIHVPKMSIPITLKLPQLTPRPDKIEINEGF